MVADYLLLKEGKGKGKDGGSKAENANVLNTDLGQIQYILSFTRPLSFSLMCSKYL